MKNTRIIRAYDTVNPTAAQKDRMLQAILQEADFPEKSVKQDRRRERREPTVYRAKPTRTNKKSSFAAIAASVALLAVSGAMLMRMMKTPESPAYAVPGETAQGPQLVTDESPYRATLQKYVTAIQENWDRNELSQAEMCENVSDVTGLDRLGFSLMDLDGDGSEELLITDGMEIYDLYTLQDGTVSRIWNGATRSRGWLCKDNIIASSDTTLAGAVTYYSFLKLENGQLQQLEQLAHCIHQDQESPWSWYHGDPYADPNAPGLTSEEADARLDGYEKIYIRNTPFHCGIEGMVKDDTIPDNAAAYAESVRQEMAQYPYAEPMTYAFYDFDEDGRQELLLGSGAAIRSIYKETGGKVEKIWVSANQSYVYLCEGRIFCEESMHGHVFSRMDGTVVEFVYHSEETNSWYKKNQEKSVDVPIDEMEAKEILNSFRRTHLDWKPIQEFPVSLETEEKSLFENVFLPVAKGTVGSSVAELKNLIESQGFEWRLWEGLISCTDPDEEGSYISVEWVDRNGLETIWTMVYGREKQGIPCQARVSFTNSGMEYFTKVYDLGAGCQVSSPDAFRSFFYDEDPNLQLRYFVECFVRAYSELDTYQLDRMLVSDLVPVDPAAIPGHGWEFKIQQLAGLETAEADYAAKGRAVVSAAYLGEPDSYTYLTMELTKIDGEWKVAAFGEEK